MMNKKVKIFIGLREVAGYGGKLKAGFDNLGIKCAFIDLKNKYYTRYKSNPKWVKIINAIAQQISKRFSNNFALSILWMYVIQNIFSVFAFFIAVFNYNTFIFLSGSTFFFYLELPLLKLLNKKIIYISLGSDTRPLYISGYVYQDKTINGLRKIKFLTRCQKLTIKIIERFADFYIDCPATGQFHEKPFINLHFIGLPVDFDKVPEAGNDKITGRDDPERPVRIFHAPTKQAKGSEFFREIIADLKAKGHAIEYILVKDKPNEYVLEEIRKCDFILDELYSDVPMGTFSAEAAIYRKPSVVGSYYTKMIHSDIPENQIPPVMYCAPEEMPASVEKLIMDKNFRDELGKKAFTFVFDNWRSEVVAEKFLRLIKNDFPGEWLYDPQNIRYFYGAGVSKDQLKDNLKKYIESGGTGSLCLNDKPLLLQEILNFAGS